VHARHGETEIPCLSAPRAEWMPGAPPSAATSRPESSAIAVMYDAFAAASAFSAAFSAKLVPVSSGSGRPRLAADTQSTS